MCRGFKKLNLRSGSKRHRHFVEFFNVPVKAPTQGNPFYTVIPRNCPFSRLFRHAGDTKGTFSISPRLPKGGGGGAGVIRK